MRNHKKKTYCIGYNSKKERITERENYNKSSDDYKQPNCFEHKADAIKDVFEHFRMI